ncbi:MAG: pitrilysin family protein [Hyphomicrobium sp.]
MWSGTGPAPHRAGAADGPKGVSGIAHFLEHLMFKSTEKVAVGEFSKIISRLGGQDNAFTAQDVTAYHQRISKDQLKTVMEMEADRMTHLRLTDDEVATERQVIIEERRSRIDNSPSAQLQEQMSATLHVGHPYGVPIIGWPDEMAKLSREDAMRFYKRYYAPNNAVLVVSGDVTPEEVRSLAEEIYGTIPANLHLDGRSRPQTTAQETARRITLKDPRAGNPSFNRYYTVPSYVRAEAGDAEALQLLIKIVGDGPTSRLYRRLVVEAKLANTTGARYSGFFIDSGDIAISAIARNGDLEAVEAGVDALFEDIRKDGVTEIELERARKSLLADHIYDGDNQERLAHRYGWAITIGLKLDQIEGWPDAISKVTTDDIKRVANQYLDSRRSVTGWLLPEAEGAAKPVAHSQS